MNILIRADGDDEIGSGHVLRCLALAYAARSRGAEVQFAAARLSDELRKRLDTDDFSVVDIDASRGSVEDRRELEHRSRAFDADWVVLDGYVFDVDFQRRIADGDASVLFIDDLGNDEIEADLVLNQNLHADPSLYPGMDESQLLLGTRFALLRSEFEQWKSWSRTVRSSVEKILVIGGSDPEKRSLDALRTLNRELLEETRIEIVGYPRPDDSWSDSRPGEYVFREYVEDVPPLMAEADLAISTSGSICWELLYMQLPALLLVVADNQRPLAEAMTEIPGYEQVDEVSTEQNDLDDKFRRLSVSEERRRMAERSREFVDGEGPRRVVEELESGSRSYIHGVAK